MSYTAAIDEIEGLPYYREYKCPRCSYEQKAYILAIQANCNNCDRPVKLRGYASLGSEIEDVVDAVLAWLGEGNELELALERKRVIDSKS
jgi:hypothetical protein